MKKLYKEFFEIPKEGPIRDKVMRASVMSIAAIVVACLVVMGTMAYAYYAANDIVIVENRIVAKEYKLDIQIFCDGAPVPVTENHFTAQAGKIYEIQMAYVEGSAKTGFCHVAVGDRVYHTVQIGADQAAPDGRRDAMTFYLVPEGTGSIQVTFEAQWGTSSRYDAQMPDYILPGDQVKLSLIDGEMEQTYAVKDGDTMWMVAQQYHTTVERIAAYNEIDVHDPLWVGQVLRIPPSTWMPS